FDADGRIERDVKASQLARDAIRDREVGALWIWQKRVFAGRSKEREDIVQRTRRVDVVDVRELALARHWRWPADCANERTESFPVRLEVLPDRRVPRVLSATFALPPVPKKSIRLDLQQLRVRPIDEPASCVGAHPEGEGQDLGWALLEVLDRRWKR